MRRLIKKVSKKAGLPPGTLVHVGEKKMEAVRIRVIDYDADHIEERDLETIDDCLPYQEKPSISWINIDGLHHVDTIEKIGRFFGLHSLILEDIVNTGQRPKMDDLEDSIFIIVKMISYDETKHEVKAEQFSMVLGSNYVISFQEKEGDVLDPVRNRLRKKASRIRKRGADYLAYALLDAIVDNYFIVLERIGEEVEALDEALSEGLTQETMQRIYHFKNELILFRKSVWPLREAIHRLEGVESTLVDDKTVLFFRDIHDHIVQVIENTEALRDMVAGMLDLYLSAVSNRMNEVMKMLTIIATIFIPLTFIAGIYGMNFKYMPELEWPWGYFLVLVLMVVVVVVMIIWFRRKRLL
jgi:magnesium transporter